MKLTHSIQKKHIAAQIALMGLLMSPSAQSFTLGDVELQSYVGQPFRAAVPYKTHAGELLTPDCVTLTQGGADLPSLGNASINISQRGEQSGMLYINSRQNIGEPIVGFGIRIECNGLQISRSFTAFLNVAPVEEPKPAPTFTAPKAVEPRENRRSNEVPNRDPETFTAKRTTTLAEITKRYYPVGTPQYPRYLNKLISVNEGLSAETPIAAGSKIIIPDLLRSSKKVPPKAPLAETGLLRLDGVALTPPTKPKAIASNSAEYTRQLEQKLLELNELQQKMQLEITQLNLQLAQMDASAASASQIVAAPVSAASVAATQAPKRAPAPAASSIIEPSPVTQESGMAWWALLIGGTSALLAGVWWILRRRKSETNHYFTEHDTSQFGPNPSYHDQAPAGFASPNTMMSALHLGGSPHGIEVEHTEEGLANDMARAQILIAQGETMDAIDILYRCIDEEPSDIERWLMLFRLFRQQGMKTEYAHLAQNLKVIEHDEADWELVRNIGAKLDPENPLYFRESPYKPQALHTASYAQAFGLEQTPPVAQELQLELDAPSSADLQMMATLKQDHGVPNQFAHLLSPTEQDYTIELPNLDVGSNANLSPLEQAAEQFDVEELNLKAIEPEHDSNVLEFDIEPIDLAKKP
ncbi:hypothetical protein NT239_09760 [Chitinibacter sp. SCUT-21]|uniref:type IV pilus assembly protein FimV n=1 Tax=Chitinibacter sp. SCUT-21 TaxID=2970891 RepID=UPI0035A638E0